jgi:UDP-N-acetylglucosamine--dolichyl-phosphate N-acetylglucosaminephosphotransferase
LTIPISFTLTVFWLAVCGLVLAFVVTYLIMPRVISFMHRHNIVGVDVHKLKKPEVAQMGGIGLVLGVSAGCLFLFFSSGFLGLGFLDYRILVFLAVVLLAGLVGVVDDLKTLGPKTKPLLTALACFPILLSSWIVEGLGLSPPLPLAYDPGPRLPFLGRARLTLVYLVIIPFGIAVPANAVNMIDIFNGAMPLTTLLMFAAMLAVSLLMMVMGVQDAFLGVVLSLVMIGALLAYYNYNRNPARAFAGDTGSLFVGAAIGALAIMGQLEIVAIVALLPAIMNAFYSLVSIGGLLERRQMKSRPTVFRGDGKLEASKESGAPLTLARLILARGPLSEQQITLCLSVLSLASSVLAVLTVLLIPFDTIGYLASWPYTLSLVLIPLIMIIGVYLSLRHKDEIGARLAGLIAIMIGVWAGGMVGFWALDLLVQLTAPWGAQVLVQVLRPLAGIAFVLAWLGLWHFTTRMYFRFELRRASRPPTRTSKA